MIKFSLKNCLTALGLGLIVSSLSAQTVVPPNDSCEYAMQFSGEGEYIQAVPSGFSKSNNFSIAGWFKTDTTEQGLMTLERDCCSDEYGFVDVDASGKLVFQFATSSFQKATVTSSTNVNDDTWHHFAAIRNSSKDSVYLFIDGVLEAETQFTQDIFLNANMRLTLGISDRTWKVFKGGMDEVSYWNKAISATEVQAIMNNKLQGDEGNLVLYYNFNEWQGYGKVKDATGNGHDLYFSDASKFTRFLPQGVGCDLPTSLTPPNNDCGAIVNFDGADDYITTNVTGSNFIDQDFSIETWVYIDSLKESGNIILSNLKDNEGFEVSVVGSSNEDYHGKLSFANRWSTTTLQVNTWYHIAFTYDDKGGEDNNQLTLYINGFEDAVYNNAKRIRNTCSCRVPLGNLLIGSSDYVNAKPNSNLQGKMDELRIWSEVRTPEQIFEMIDSSLTDTTSNLIATFDFNDGNNATHIHSLTGKVSAEGELKNMDLGAAWSKLDGSPTGNTFSETIAENICGTFTSVNGNFYTEDGTYVDVLTNNSGCDSNVRVVITFDKTLPKTFADINVNGQVLEAADPNSLRGFEWYNCDKPELGILSTETTFTPTESGNYKLHVTVSGWCPAISECIEIKTTTTSTLESTALGKVKHYPNPTEGLITIDFGNNFDNVSVEVYSIAGELVDNVFLGSASNAVVNISGKSGVYFLHIKVDGGLKTSTKVIKK